MGENGFRNELLELPLNECYIPWCSGQGVSVPLLSLLSSKGMGMGSGPLINCYTISALSYVGGHHPKYLVLRRENQELPTKGSLL